MSRGSMLTLVLVFMTSHAHEEWSALHHVRPSALPAEQSQAVVDMIGRLLPGRSAEFVITVDPGIGPPSKDAFVLQTDVEGRLHVTGTSGVAAALGMGYFLQHYCGCQVTWAGRQLLVPSPLPQVSIALKVETNDRFFYYQNVCTISYSSVWWNWSRWEQEIDWMALKGINMPLAFSGQEIIWKRVYLSLGFSEDDIDAWMSGPAFLAWWRMGNLQRWGGRLPTYWLDHQAALQHRILGRMRAFGMIAVLPAFAGHVPSAIKQLFPSARATRLGDWNKFNCSYSCTYFLDPSDPLFQKIGSAFISELVQEYGTDHLYNSDPFNEEVPESSDPQYLASISAAIYKSITSSDAGGVWILQGWMFRNDEEFWQLPQAKALLTAVPLGRLIVLDLQAEAAPVFASMQSYFGQPFIWCFLHNFGGNLGLYGSASSANVGPFGGRTFPSSTMIGTGLTMEGIHQNEYLYELMSEMHWHTAPVNLTQWTIDFIGRRYGVRSEDTIDAWLLLAESVYAPAAPLAGHERYIITLRPAFGMISNIYYDKSKLLTAWKYMISAIKSSEGTLLTQSSLFRYDLVDITREVFAVALDSLYPRVLLSYSSGNMTALSQAADFISNMLNDMDSVLATEQSFLLGAWLESAKQNAASSADEQLFEYNARNQITLWGPVANILDYASKQWSGVISGYYSGRWKLFIAYLINAVVQDVPFNRTAFNIDIFTKVEEPFTFSQAVYPSVPVDDTVLVSLELFNQYWHIFNQLLNSPNDIFTW